MQETLVWFLGREDLLEKDRLPTAVFLGFSCGSAGKEPTHNAGDLGLIPESGRSPGERKGYPLQYSSLENYMDCIVHGVTKSQTWLSSYHFHFALLYKIHKSRQCLKKNSIIEQYSQVPPAHRENALKVSDPRQKACSTLVHWCARECPSAELHGQDVTCWAFLIGTSQVKFMWNREVGPQLFYLRLLSRTSENLECMVRKLLLSFPILFQQ